MSSLAFILNPLDRSGSGSCGASATHAHAHAPTISSPPTAPLPTSSAMKRPLPRLAAAIAPVPSTFSDWTALQQQQLLLHRALAPLSTIAAHQFALDTHHFASLPDPAALQTRKKQRHTYIATPVHDNNGDDDDDDGAASPTTSSEGEESGCEDGAAPIGSKKKTRLCKEPGCTSLAVSRRSCVRHGGGSRCTFAGCSNGAKLRNRCFQHGGSTICLAAGCASKAKRYGYCWSHGGGRICSTDGCVKVAAQGGSCWAHGGGNRCKLDGCSKRSYQKHGYYCKAHAGHNVV